MKITEAIQTQKKRIARLERNQALQKIKERKQETRRKIELGGLVVKAHMDQYPKVIVLGALIDAWEQLEHDTSIHSLFRAKGEAAFMEYKDE